MKTTNGEIISSKVLNVRTRIVHILSIKKIEKNLLMVDEDIKEELIALIKQKRNAYTISTIRDTVFKPDTKLTKIQSETFVKKEVTYEKSLYALEVHYDNYIFNSIGDSVSETNYTFLNSDIIAFCLFTQGSCYGSVYNELVYDKTLHQRNEILDLFSSLKPLIIIDYRKLEKADNSVWSGRDRVCITVLRNNTGIIKTQFSDAYSRTVDLIILQPLCPAIRLCVGKTYYFKIISNSLLISDGRTMLNNFICHAKHVITNGPSDMIYSFILNQFIDKRNDYPSTFSNHQKIRQLRISSIPRNNIARATNNERRDIYSSSAPFCIIEVATKQNFSFKGSLYYSPSKDLVNDSIIIPFDEGKDNLQEFMKMYPTFLKAVGKEDAARIGKEFMENYGNDIYEIGKLGNDTIKDWYRRCFQTSSNDTKKLIKQYEDMRYNLDKENEEVKFFLMHNDYSKKLGIPKIETGNDKDLKTIKCSTFIEEEKVRKNILNHNIDPIKENIISLKIPIPRDKDNIYISKIDILLLLKDNKIVLTNKKIKGVVLDAEIKNRR